MAAAHPGTAKAFIDFLASPAAVPIIRKSGLEAIAVAR
jgi:ABC-type molybdate transport system substrate-binding protein